METLRIHQLTTRYRLPASALEERARLDRVLRQMLDEVLEAALERAGVPTHEEICVRELHVPVRLRLEAADSSLAVDWSLALVEALKEALVKGGAGVVHYGSRHHALVDVALSAARGELSRTWAWKQLGMWSLAGNGVSEAEAVREANRALLADPRAIVPVISELARAGALLRFIELTRADGATALARAALTHSAAPAALAVPAPSEEAPRAASAPSSLERQVARILGASKIARAIVSSAGATHALPTEARSLRALAVFSVLEAEPTAFRQGPRASTHLLLDVEQRLRTSASGTPTASRGPAAEASSPRQDPARASSNQERESTPDASVQGKEPAPDASTPRRDSTADATTQEPESTPDSALTQVRRRGTTRAAGLLFLLHIVDELGLPDTLLSSEFAAVRGPRWMLHQLALTLQPLEPADPAALAFAGLAPDAEPPSEGEPPPTDAERDFLAACATRIVERTRERLGQPDEPREKLLLFVCRRRGEVVADPGWIEIRMELDEVSTELRRAGLDLNPDWLPWLGVVMRFTYA
ncbi:contractile injection system tape measure protein [Hyalangium gracile]|uniref:contractile injection system tape measure protein n=1 Tax=Hyalangium gracile TaxID=394092 RepID=UPI001CCFAA32|nr:contractile injection system tape measure protein [Hyalangium gracile]